MKKIKLIIAISLLPFAQMLAQGGNLFSFQYSIGFGVGDLNDFIGKTSWRGANIEYRKLINDDKLGIGVEVGWTAWYESPGYVTFEQGSQALSGYQYRYLSTVPMMGAFDYYLKPGAQLNPFIGLGIGTEYSRNEVDMGLYTWREDAWHFLLRPEVGVIASPNPHMGIYIAAKYNNAFDASEIKTRSYIGLNIGLAWTY